MSKSFRYWVRCHTAALLCGVLIVNPVWAGRGLRSLLSRQQNNACCPPAVDRSCVTNPCAVDPCQVNPCGDSLGAAAGCGNATAVMPAMGESSSIGQIIEPASDGGSSDHARTHSEAAVDANQNSVSPSDTKPDVAATPKANAAPPAPPAPEAPTAVAPPLVVPPVAPAFTPVPALPVVPTPSAAPGQNANESVQPNVTKPASPFEQPSTPEVAPAPPADKPIDAPVEEDPFSAPVKPAELPAEPEANDPFGSPDAKPAETKPAAPALDNDPFGAPAAPAADDAAADAPAADAPADAPADEAAPAAPADNDPFGAPEAPATESSTESAEPADNDPFGAPAAPAAQEPAESTEPAEPADNDPFGAPAAPATDKPADADKAEDNDPFGAPAPKGADANAERDLFGSLQLPATDIATDDFTDLLVKPAADEANSEAVGDAVVEEAALIDAAVLEPAATVDPLAATQVRTWHDNTGSFEVTGRLVVVLDDHVRLLKDNGRFTTVPVRRLSVEDRQYVDQTLASTQLITGKFITAK